MTTRVDKNKFLILSNVSSFYDIISDNNRMRTKTFCNFMEKDGDKMPTIDDNSSAGEPVIRIIDIDDVMVVLCGVIFLTIDILITVIIDGIIISFLFMSTSCPNTPLNTASPSSPKSNMSLLVRA